MVEGSGLDLGNPRRDLPLQRQVRSHSPELLRHYPPPTHPSPPPPLPPEHRSPPSPPHSTLRPRLGWGLGLKVSSLGCGVSGAGFRVSGVES